jgi:hypothetical protein
MTIDERLEKLTERHEALTQTVEVTAMQRDNEKSIAEVTLLARADGENIRALARIAEIHHERLSHLEDQQ